MNSNKSLITFGLQEQFRISKHLDNLYQEKTKMEVIQNFVTRWIHIAYFNKCQFTNQWLSSLGIFTSDQ